MRRNTSKAALYESIMRKVSKQVKGALNERYEEVQVTREYRKHLTEKYDNKGLLNIILSFNCDDSVFEEILNNMCQYNNEITVTNALINEIFKYADTDTLKECGWW